jgi:hypothetical protein
MMSLHFILETLTPDGPLYVQHLDERGRVLSLVDNPVAALEFEAQACQCDEAYFIIVPRLHGSVWETYRPVAILPLSDVPDEQDPALIRTWWLWITSAVASFGIHPRPSRRRSVVDWLHPRPVDGKNLRPRGHGHSPGHSGATRQNVSNVVGSG